MKKILILMAATALFFSCHNEPKKYDVTFDNLLDEMICRDAITRYPAIEYKQAQVSSYDRRTVSPDEPGWWANNDGGGYERLDTVSSRIEKVMCDIKGAGVVTRIWMTTKEKFGTMRIYLDGAKRPQIVIPAYDMKRFPIDIPAGLSLTHTHYDEAMEGVGGNSFFLPIPFAEGCKITFEEPDITANIPRYYHIGYRLYPEGTSIKTFTLKDAKAASGKVNEVSDRLLGNGKEASRSDCSCLEVTQKETLISGSSLQLNLPEGQKAIRSLVFHVKDFMQENYADVMRSLWVEAGFDGTLTISAPLSDFSGGGIGAHATDGWWLYSDGNGTVECRYPMPYRNNGWVRILNTGQTTASVMINASVSDYEWDNRSLYFHASWRSEEGIPVSPDYDSNDNLDWNFMTISGRGKYVGDLLTLNNHAIDWYGEGDEKIFVDGEAFPSHMGTGTEDYFNCSWAPVVPFLTPYGGAPRADETSSHGYNSFLRTRILDDIPFSESFKFDIEMLSWHPGTVDYYTSSFWYGDIDARANTLN